MHERILSLDAKTTLEFLGKTKLLDTAYLAGGTALALHLGHRKSEDLDFCIREPLYVHELERKLKETGRFKTTQIIEPHTLIGVFNQTKFSIFRYDYPFVKPCTPFLGIPISSVEDIAAMKLSAITGRAKKRDYVDIYTICQTHSIEEQMNYFRTKFGDMPSMEVAIIKSLGYFEDVDDDVMPTMLAPLSWEEVKNDLTKEAVRIAKKWFGMDS